MLRKLFSRTAPDEAPLRLYAGIVAQARNPAFYGALGVPDTVEGRFDMIVLHSVLVMRRLRREGEPGRTLAQAVFDAFFKDMDRSLREMGVTDFGVPKRIKKMAQAFYGRAAAYDPPLDGADVAALAAALRRNVYSGSEPKAEAGAAALAIYALDSERALGGLSHDGLARSELVWPAEVPQDLRETA